MKKNFPMEYNIETKDEKTVFYYRNLSNLELLLKNGLWLSNIKEFNDTKDGKFPYNQVINFSEKIDDKCRITWTKLIEDLSIKENIDILNNEKILLENIFKNAGKQKKENRKKCYVTCLTDKESIPMWVHYGRDYSLKDENSNYENGVMIEFYHDKLIFLIESKISNQDDLIVGNVMYGNDAKDFIINEVKKYLKNKFLYECDEIDKLKKSLEVIQYFRKRKEWKYEKEYRIVLKLDGEQCKGKIIKDIDFKNAIKSVTIPSNSSEKYIEEINSLVGKYSWELKISEILMK